MFYRNRREPAELTTMVSQLFLGVRLDCAKCHHHPFEVWGQDDFYSFAAFFGRIGRKGQGISAPISRRRGGDLPRRGRRPARRGGDSWRVKHPITGKVMTPTPLLGQPLDLEPEQDPREVLADWVTSAGESVLREGDRQSRLGRPDGPRHRRSGGRHPRHQPAVEPRTARRPRGRLPQERLRPEEADPHDLPPATCISSRTTPNDRNVADLRNYSRHYRQRLRAEVLLDMVSDITGVPEKFEAMPPGSRAMEVWTARSQSVFLDSFGRPDPNQDPPCERTTDTTVVQALHLMNSPNLYRKVTSDDGRCAAWRSRRRVRRSWLRSFISWRTAASRPILNVPRP